MRLAQLFLAVEDFRENNRSDVEGKNYKWQQMSTEKVHSVFGKTVVTAPFKKVLHFCVVHSPKWHHGDFQTDTVIDRQCDAVSWPELFSRLEIVCWNCCFLNFCLKVLPDPQAI